MLTTIAAPGKTARMTRYDRGRITGLTGGDDRTICKWLAGGSVQRVHAWAFELACQMLEIDIPDELRTAKPQQPTGTEG